MQRESLSEVVSVEVDGRVGDVLSGPVLGVADVAIQSDVTDTVRPLENGLDPLVVAGLAEIVRRCDRFVFDTIFPSLSALIAVNEVAGAQIDKRVTTAVFKGLTQTGHLFTIFDHVALQLKQLGVVEEETLLRLEQLVVDLADRSRVGVEVPDAESCIRSFLGEFERRDGTEN